MPIVADTCVATAERTTNPAVAGPDRGREHRGIVRVSSLTAACGRRCGAAAVVDRPPRRRCPPGGGSRSASGSGSGSQSGSCSTSSTGGRRSRSRCPRCPPCSPLPSSRRVVAIPVRVICSVGLIWAMYRPKPYKLVFNAALFTFEAALAFVIARAIVRPDEFVAGPFLVAAAIGVMASTFVGALMVSVAIAAFEGGLGRRLIGEVKTNLVIGPISSLIAAVALAPALFGIEYALLSLVPVVAVWLVLLRYGRLAQHHRDLEAVHDFASVAGGSLAVTEVAPVAVAEVVRLLRAESACCRCTAATARPSSPARRAANAGTHGAR